MVNNLIKEDSMLCSIMEHGPEVIVKRYHASYEKIVYITNDDLL